MKLATIAIVAGLAATPAFAADTYPDSTAAAPSPSVDDQTATKDAARQNYYQDKLDAANAQTKADNAQARAEQSAADRDAALDRAAQDRAAQERSAGQAANPNQQ